MKSDDSFLVERMSPCQFLSPSNAYIFFSEKLVMCEYLAIPFFRFFFCFFIFDTSAIRTASRLSCLISRSCVHQHRPWPHLSFPPLVNDFNSVICQTRLLIWNLSMHVDLTCGFTFSLISSDILLFYFPCDVIWPPFPLLLPFSASSSFLPLLS